MRAEDYYDRMELLVSTLNQLTSEELVGDNLKSFVRTNERQIEEARNLIQAIWKLNKLVVGPKPSTGEFISQAKALDLRKTYKDKFGDPDDTHSRGPVPLLNFKLLRLRAEKLRTLLSFGATAKGVEFIHLYPAINTFKDDQGLDVETFTLILVAEDADKKMIMGSSLPLSFRAMLGIGANDDVLEEIRPCPPDCPDDTLP